MSTDHQTEKRIAAACDAMRAGLPVVLLDDHDREDEADLIAAAETLSHDVMARLIRDCSGIVCLCLDDRLHDATLHAWRSCRAILPWNVFRNPTPTRGAFRHVQ